MKSIKALLIFSIALMLFSCQESPKDYWENFNDEIWSATVEQLDKEHQILEAKTNKFLYFRTVNGMEVKFAVFRQSDHPDLLKNYKEQVPCFTDLLSGQHGQIRCSFAFKDQFYFQTSSVFDEKSCNLSPKSKNDCTQLAFAIRNYIR